MVGGGPKSDFEKVVQSALQGSRTIRDEALRAQAAASAAGAGKSKKRKRGGRRRR